ncbi:MAG: hypothetical protein LUC35_00070 [Clostridiales bacterium]|nr:hypothetical protein [Clostridiales bacterium]
MKTSDIIYQLESIREDSAERASHEDEPDNVWANDVAALDAAIGRLQGQPKRTEAALIILTMTAVLGLIAAFAGIAVALFGGYKAGTVLLAASCGWWLESIIAGRDCR